MGKVLFAGQRCYRLSVAPSGSRLRLTPMQLSLGSVAGSGTAYHAVLTNDDCGVVAVSGKKGEKIALAEGTWKLVSYTLDATAGGGRTAVDAAFANDCRRSSSKGRDGQTAVREDLPRGRYRDEDRQGKGFPDVGRCWLGRRALHSLLVKGGRPPKPHFTIKDKDGKIVQEGDFEYG